MLAAGLENFEINWRADVFSGAPQHSSAAAFGTLGINFRAVKPLPMLNPLDHADRNTAVQP